MSAETEAVLSAVRTIAAWPEVASALDEARDACTALRWHEALRRRIPECAAESRVRGAWASAELEGAPSSVDVVRELSGGLREWAAYDDPTELVVRSAVQVTAETEHLRTVLRRAPAQVVARLHVAAASLLSPADQVGRPRTDGEDVAEFVDVGPAPAAVDATRRLREVTHLLTLVDAPGLVVAALVHAEVVTARPFVRGNGLVARALERLVVQASGLDPTGVAVPEAGHEMAGSAAYVGALAGYATGTREGVALWVTECGKAIVAAAAEGSRVADAVRAGRWTQD